MTEPGSTSHTCSDFFNKAWDPSFSTDRNIKDDNCFDKHKRSQLNVQPDLDGIHAFLRDYDDDFPSTKVKVVEEFCRDTSSIHVHLGTGAAIERRAAWLDDRSHPREGRSADYRPLLRPPNAWELYLLLKERVRMSSSLFTSVATEHR